MESFCRMTVTTTPSIIAIDGPAASGKSTLGHRLALELDYLFFDTGTMYRAITLLAIEQGLDLHDEAAITHLAQQTEIDIRAATVKDGRTCDVLVEGRDVTWEIRRRRVDANVSIIAAYSGVREALKHKQHRIGMRGRVVMVGRDIGTVILPEADLKIYLDASAEERARRRSDEITARSGQANYDEILEKVMERDLIDSTREVAPLRPADDAVVINTDHLSADDVLKRILSLCK
jgi:cytidylate kinase